MCFRFAFRRNGNTYTRNYGKFSGENKVEGNVIYKNINDIFDIPGVFIHIYGKKKSRLNRKMGHITIVNRDIEKAIEISKKIKKEIKVIS